MPGVLFLCVHNAGRSQMAAGFAQYIGGNNIEIFSGGTEPADAINPVAVEVMKEVGIDISRSVPQVLTDDMLHRVDVVVTMGCGDTCPYIDGKTYLDWPLEDPKGKSIETVREIRTEIENRVRDLLRELIR
jgi:arsenate reductase (thioredoxin)